MNVIEFIGPSGAGKTFLYEKLFRLKSRDRGYLSLTEACVKAARRYKIRNKLSPIYFMQVLLGLEFVKWKRRGLANSILKSQFKNPLIPESFNISFGILMKCMMSESNPEIVHKRIANFIERARQLSVLEQYSAEDDWVVFDEGLLHHHHGLHPDIIQHYPEELIYADQALRPRAVIFCELPAELVFERALKRRESGTQTFSHRFLTEVQLKDYIHRNVEDNNHKLSFLEQTGIPVLRIDMNANWFDNIACIDSFINALLARKD